MPDALSDAKYDDFSMTSTYLNFPGSYGCPVSGPDGTPPSVFKLHALYQHRVITWLAVRTGAPPAAPLPAALDSRSVLLEAQIGVVTPVQGVVGGAHQYALSGTYRYLMVQPYTGDLPSGKYPTGSDAASDNTYPASSFDPTLVGN